MPGAAALGAAAHDKPLALWYRQPAERWTDGLPIGNGRLGAMVFGGVANEDVSAEVSFPPDQRHGTVVRIPEKLAGRLERIRR